MKNKYLLIVAVPLFFMVFSCKTGETGSEGNFKNYFAHFEAVKDSVDTARNLSYHSTRLIAETDSGKK